MCICVYIYIYIWREREGKGDNKYVPMINLHVYVISYNLN